VHQRRERSPCSAIPAGPIVVLDELPGGAIDPVPGASEFCEPVLVTIATFRQRVKDRQMTDVGVAYMCLGFLGPPRRSATRYGARREPEYGAGRRCDPVLCGDSPQDPPQVDRSGGIPEPSVTVRRKCPVFSDCEELHHVQRSNQ
jgi:hypothetical protein